MVHELTDEEQELAARTSYTYWVSSELKQAGCPSEKIRIGMAMREARRHLVGEGHYEKGLAALRASCVYRKVSLCFEAYFTCHCPSQRVHSTT